jgi:hypothetical protein
MNKQGAETGPTKKPTNAVHGIWLQSPNQADNGHNALSRDFSFFVIYRSIVDYSSFCLNINIKKTKSIPNLWL